MLDVHTHILPDMDDGSQSAEQSLAMLKREAEQQVDTVVFTPHYNANRESPLAFEQRRNLAIEMLQPGLKSQEHVPLLLSGAEVAFFEGMSRVEDLEPLCIEGTRGMLIEMPFCTWNQRMLGELKSLQQLRNIRPILAHVERYQAYHVAGMLEELSESGICLQSNASFFLRWQTSRQAMSQLKRHLINFIASDCHGLEYRPPNLGVAMDKIRKKLGHQTMAFLQRNEEWLLGGG